MTQKATKKTASDREREILISMRSRPMSKARMTVRMFGMTMAIPKTMIISRTVRRSREGIRISFIHLRH